MRINRKLKKNAAAYAFISPFYILFAVFVAYPLLHSAWLSLFDCWGLQTRAFCGLANFRELAHDPLLGKAIVNTLAFAAGSIFIQLPLALTLALALNSRIVRARHAFRFAFFSPVLIAGVFVGIIFQLVLNQNYGLLNSALSSPAPAAVLSAFGVDASQLAWLRDEKLIMPSLILTAIWRWTGYNMVYFLAGLQAIRQELYEAASIDGAGAWGKLLNVTLPGLRPVLLFVVIMSMLGSLQIFDLPYILLSGGNPNDAGLMAVMHLYAEGFQNSRLGYASAMGWLLFGIIFLFTLAQWRMFGGKET